MQVVELALEAVK